MDESKILTPKEMAEKAIAKMNERITDEIFIIIQNDRELMRDYLYAVQENGLRSVNTTIGKEVKDSYGLTNADEREGNPKCTLIQSHQIFLK